MHNNNPQLNPIFGEPLVFYKHERKLFRYQEEGVKWLQTAGRHLLLADEMGLGKTIQAIWAAITMPIPPASKFDLVPPTRSQDNKNILVICPAVAKVNWKREWERWEPKRTVKILGAEGKGVKISGIKNNVIREGSVNVCSYNYVANPKTHDKLKNFPWDIIILDESHFLKSPTTDRTKAIFGKLGLVHSAKRVWALSGTPIPNHAGEIWTLLYTFGKTNLTYNEFLRKFCNGYQHNYQFRVTGTKKDAIPELQKLLDTVMLRREKGPGMLPDIFYSDLVVDRSPVDLELCSSFAQWVVPYDRSSELKELLDTELNMVNSVFKKTGTTSVQTMKLLEAMASSIATLRRYTGLQKVQACADIVSQELESKQYEKIVIFAIHQDVIELLRKKLFKYGPVTLYGGTPEEKRTKHIDRFQNNPKCQVFIGNIQACGTAINLTAAHNVLFVEQDWTPGNNAQAAMRCHRIGQTKPVNVRFASLADSFDQNVSFCLRRKTESLAEIFNQNRLPNEKRVASLEIREETLTNADEPTTDIDILK